MQSCDIDWGATVSACAAVVQGIGSIWAIRAATKNSRAQAKTAIDLANKQTREARRIALYERRKADEERNRQRLDIQKFFLEQISPLRLALEGLEMSAKAGEPQVDQTGRIIHHDGVEPLQAAVNNCITKGGAVMEVLSALKGTFAMQPGPTLFILALFKVANGAKNINFGNNIGKYQHYQRVARSYLDDIDKAFSHL